MSDPIVVNESVSGGGLVLQPTPAVRAVENPSPYEFSPAAGNAGTLTTRSDATTGTLTLNDGHTIETGDTVDIHWVASGTNYCQRDCTVGTVSGNSVPFSGGVGTDLPAVSSSVVCTEQETENVTCDASGLAVFAAIVEEPTAVHTQGVQLRFLDSGGSEVYTLLTARNQLTKRDVTGGDTNPFGSTDIASMSITNGSSSLAVKLKLLIGQDV